VKPDIHPKYFEAKVHCDVCGNCHPFYTGKQTIIDTAGQVERFQKRLERQVRS
jgi:large subunit ribosomal protein L31